MREGNGLPVANCTTPANGNEREQLIPLIDATNLKTHKRGRPPQRFQVIAADHGLDSQRQRQALRRRGIRPQLPKRLWKGKKKPGRGIKISVPRFQLLTLFGLVST